MKQNDQGAAKIQQDIAALAQQCSQRTLAVWAAECAARVLHYFEEAYPKDARPRQALGANAAWLNNAISVQAARDAAFAAHAAAREAQKFSACAAARSAGHAAATVHVGMHALSAAEYAAKAISYSVDPEQSADATAQECRWQYERLGTLLKEQGPAVSE